MIKKIVHSLLLVGLLSGAILPAFVHAQAAPAPFKDGFKTVDDIGDKAGVKPNLFIDPRDRIRKILVGVLSVVAFGAIVALVIGGIMYIAALGNEDKAKRAKQVILYTILGLIIIGLSAIIVNLIIFFLFTP